MSAKKRFYALDSFRGIFALLVVCFHARILLGFTEATFFRNGFWFVDFFFVLSGFVMLHTYGDGLFTKSRFKDYILSRFFRLYPMHFLMLIVVVFIEFFKLYAQKKGIIFNNPAFTETTKLSDLIPNLLLLQAWLPRTNIWSYNTVSWSISVEFYLYILFGLTLLCKDKMRGVLFVGLILLASILFNIGTGFMKPEALRGLYCFFGGCVSYIIYHNLPSITRFRTSFTILELFLIVAIIIVLSSDFPQKRITINLLFSITIIAFALENGSVSDALKLRPFTFLGKLSYSIYITHFVLWFLFIAAAMVLTKITGMNFTVVDNSGSQPIRFITTHHIMLDQLVLFGLLGLVITISNFTYKYVEVKGIAFGKQLKNKSAKHNERAILPEVTAK
jgi:peptidoglycan/LPS O-acetylase OafA/YrhL